MLTCLAVLLAACGQTPQPIGPTASPLRPPPTASASVGASATAAQSASASAVASAVPASASAAPATPGQPTPAQPTPAPPASIAATGTPDPDAPFACVTQLQPAPPAAGAVIGQSEDDLGHGHVVVGTRVTYAICPPASGSHYSSNGLGPIAPRFYGPNDGAVPQGWIHNLEHGGIVLLYNCNAGACETAALEALRAFAAAFPTSPRCHIPTGLLSPVVARFDQMNAKYAAVVWDRVLLQQALDTAQIAEFWKNVGETTNPEKFCDPGPTAPAGGSGSTAFR